MWFSENILGTYIILAADIKSWWNEESQYLAQVIKSVCPMCWYFKMLLVKCAFHPLKKKKSNLSWVPTTCFFEMDLITQIYAFYILSLNIQCKHTESSDLYRKRQNPLYALSYDSSANVKSVFNLKEKEMLLEQYLETQSLTYFQNFRNSFSRECNV